MLKKLLLDLVFPPRCVGCGRLGRYICVRCQKQIEARTQLCPGCDRPAIDGLTHPGCKTLYGLDGVISLYRYFGVVKGAIKQLKYRFVSDIASSLVNGVTKVNFSFLPLTTKIYPIPLHPERLKWRGFNQAQKLTYSIAPILNLSVTERLLERKTKKTPQADIHTRAERIKNAQGIFQLAKKDLPSSILLIDDVYTTGATMKEAAKVLKRGGVKKVYGLTIAR